MRRPGRCQDGHRSGSHLSILSGLYCFLPPRQVLWRLDQAGSLGTTVHIVSRVLSFQCSAYILHTVSVVSKDAWWVWSWKVRDSWRPLSCQREGHPRGLQHTVALSSRGSRARLLPPGEACHLARDCGWGRGHGPEEHYRQPGAWTPAAQRYPSRAGVGGGARREWQEKHWEPDPACGEPSVCLRDGHRQQLKGTFRGHPSARGKAGEQPPFTGRGLPETASPGMGPHR